jgi:hypothetical protein
VRRAFCAAIVTTWMAAPALRAADREFLEDFEGSEVSWTVGRKMDTTKVEVHRRQTRFAHGGRSAEELRISNTEVGRELFVTRKIPPARAIEDFQASMWVRSRAAGVRFALGIVFPHQKDPRLEGDRPLTAMLEVAEYPGLGQWEQLTCGTDQAAMQRLQARIRVKLKTLIDSSQIDFSDAYVERVVLSVPVSPGTCEIQWDDLLVTPIVAPEASEELDPGAASEAREARISFANDRLLRDSQPIISRFVTYQGERADLLREMYVNAVWIDRYDDTALISGLSGEGLGVFATPPRPIEVEKAGTVSMTPFTDDTAGIDCWMLGRLDYSELEQVVHWTEQLQDADRRYSRPLLGDASGHIRHFHRHVPLLGVSRHIPHTSLSPVEYAEFLEQRRLQALPGRPLSTLLPTESSDATLASRKAADHAPVVEPETISLCAHTAAASGYRLLGFWTRTPLDDAGAGMEERRHMIKLLNIELQLLEPWLATGTINRIAEVRRPGDIPQRKKKSSLNPFLPRREVDAADAAQPSTSPIRAIELKGESGLLILVDWLEANAQYQPGQMTAQNLKFVATRFDDTTQAWEVSTTDLRQIPIDLQPVSGGLEVPLAKFDQHAAIVMTSSPVEIESLKQRIRAVCKPAAESWVALATAKLTRVERTHAEIQTLAPGNKLALQTLAAANRSLEIATDELRAGRYAEARQASQKVLELTRIVQRSDWDQAVAQVISPVSSPHTICFQTLPDHWRLMNNLKLNPPDVENLLPSGDFEDENAVAAQWQFQSPHTRGDTDIVAEVATLREEAIQGKYAFQMLARPARERLPIVEEPVITGLSPAITVYAGQVVRITGSVLVSSEVIGGVDGLMVYDTIKGSIGAQRFRRASPNGKWESFELIREVKQSGDLQIIFEMRGLGDVRIDDVQVHATKLNTAGTPAK